LDRISRWRFGSSGQPWLGLILQLQKAERHVRGSAESTRSSPFGVVCPVTVNRAEFLPELVRERLYDAVLLTVHDRQTRSEDNQERQLI